MKQIMQRILIVNVNWRGDVLFSTPFIRAIRKNYPDSFIACLVAGRCVPILENNSNLNEVIVLDEQGKHKGFWGKLRLIRQLGARRFDLVFLLHRSATRALICWLAGIPERIGYYTRKRAIFLTKGIAPPSAQLHKVEYFLNIAKEMGLETENKDYEFNLSAKDKDYVSQLLREYGLKDTDFLMVINPGGNWPFKRWPKENFAKVSDKIAEKHQAKIIITGGKEDIGLAREIAAGMRSPAVILAGQTTLGELAALLACVKVVISNDSGPLHIALSQKVKTICLFGPTSAQITGPYGSGKYVLLHKDIGCAIPCYQLDCRDNRCMKAITVEDVLAAVDEIMKD